MYFMLIASEKGGVRGDGCACGDATLVASDELIGVLVLVLSFTWR
jgi:hypothetical protein